MDGPGIRSVVFVAGCPHHCEGCHNPDSWDMDGGTEMAVDDIVSAATATWNGVTISGGDPFSQPEDLTALCTALKGADKNVWVYTGFLWEEIQNAKALHCIDVLVDGPYVKAMCDETLRFRGSSNQRIIDVQASLRQRRPVLWREGL